MKIAVTGANGLLGKKLVETFEHSIGFTRADFDLTDGYSMTKALASAEFDVLIHTAALTDVVMCEEERELAYSVNSLSSANLCAYCEENNKLFVFVSTDYVFDGDTGPYYEDSKTNPANYYGETKSLAEKYIHNISADHIIVRVPILYGFNDSNDKMTFPRSVISALSQGKTVEADSERFKYPILIDDVANNIDQLIGSDIRGIVNFHGAEGLTRYEWARRIAKEFGYDEARVKAVKEASYPKRPVNVELLSRHQLSFTGVREAIIKFKTEGTYANN